MRVPALLFILCAIAAVNLVPLASLQAAAKPSTEGASPPAPAEPKVKPRTTPIEVELNRALQRSLDRARRNPYRGGNELQRTRISVTHTLSAPLPAKDEGDRGSVYQELRKQLYTAIGDECRMLSEAFNRKCSLTNLTVRPVNSSRFGANEVQITATASYTLGMELDQ